MRRLTTGTIVVALLGISSQGIADTISMNFVENPGNQVFAGGEMIGPLATNSSFWNHNSAPTTGDFVAGTLTGLMDGTGAATGVDIQWLCSNNWYNGDGTGDDQHKLSVGYLDDGDTGTGKGVVITLTNIPYTTYRVHGLYATDQGNPGAHATNYNVNGVWALGGDSATTAPAYGRIDDNFAANGEYWTELDPTGAVWGNYWAADTAGATCVITGEKRNGSARGCLTAVIIEELPEAGTAFCPGDGSSSNCPCSNINDGSMSGCDWQSTGGLAGGTLTATGSNLIADNDTFLVASNVGADFGVFFFAPLTFPTNNTLGDGLRCIGAGGGIRAIRLTNAGGATGGFATHTTPLQQLDPGASTPGTRHYQYWFRTVGGPCGNNSNTTNAYSITWM